MRPLSVIAAVALPIGGAVATSPALRAPALAVSGSSVLGIRCVCVATGVGVGLGVDAGRRGLSNALARGMFAAYGTMGLAAS